MLANLNSLIDLVTDFSYEKKFSGSLFILRGEKWKKYFGILISNILFMFEFENYLEKPSFIILVEDCLVEPLDDNRTGKQFSFSIKFKTTGRIFEFATVNLESLSNWISFITISSVDYMLATKEFLQQSINYEIKTNDVLATG